MIVTFELVGDDLRHMTPQQFGAFVAHCMKMENIFSVQVFRGIEHNGSIQVSFSIPSPTALIDRVKLLSQLETERAIFGSMEPFPCPCGCGAFISVSPCLRQSGELQEHNMTMEEMEMARGNNKIGAIKAIRMRTGLGLKDAKDICDKYCWTLPVGSPGHYPKTRP